MNTENPEAHIIKVKQVQDRILRYAWSVWPPYKQAFCQPRELVGGGAEHFPTPDRRVRVVFFVSVLPHPKLRVLSVLHPEVTL
jgi:hypothetical protein